MVVVIIVSDAECQPLREAVGDLAGGAVTPHLLWEPCCLEMESGGAWEEARRRASASQTKMGKCGRRAGKERYCSDVSFPSSQLFFCPLHTPFFSKFLFLISSGMGS